MPATTAPRSVHLLQLAAIFAGSVTIILGLLVLVGWYTGSTVLIQVIPPAAPMPPNSALSFLLGGAALVALSLEWSRLTLACAASIAVLNLLTLAEYMLGANLGTETLLLPLFPFTPLRPSGRVAPNTAVCFVLAGIALLLLTHPRRFRQLPLMAEILGVVVLALGAVAGFGYLVDLPPAYQWGYASSMAVHAAAGITVLGIGIIVYTWSLYRSKRAATFRWIPGVVGIGVTVITLYLWRALIAHEHTLIERKVTIAKVEMINRIQQQITASIRPLVRMARRWEVTGAPRQDEWETDATLHVRDYPGLQAIALADASFTVRWVVPWAGHDVMQYRSLLAEESQRLALEQIRSSYEATATHTFDLTTGSKGFHVYVPIFQSGDVRGLIVGVFHVQSLLDMLIKDIAPGFAITVLDGKERIYGRYHDKEQLDRVWGQDGWLILPGVLWRVRLWPTPELFEQEFSAVPDIVLITGLLSAMLLAAIVHFAQTTRRHTAQAITTNQALHYEIAERKRAEAALRVSYQFLQSTLDALPAHIAILDASGTIIAVNMAWSQFADANGFEGPTYGVGMNYLDVCDRVRGEAAGEAQAVARGIREVMEQQRDTFVWEYTCPSVSESRWFLMRVVRFDSVEGVRVVVVHENITALKQAESQMQRQQEALYQQEKLAAMGFLLASVAHELNNPLSVVMMQADLLREELGETSLVERVAELNQSAERCVRIVRNFLTLARQNPPQRTAVQLNAVVEEVMTLLAYALRVDNIDVHQQLDADLPTLWADPYQLHQVVLNIVTNAQQALRETAASRQLTITTQTDAAGAAVVLEVADTGRGIPAELQGRIFEPFFTTKPPGIGTGLGLPLCQGIVESHGGTISVRSQPGRGTVFRVEIPITVVPLTKPSVPATEPSSVIPMPQKAILVVDDEAGIAKALAYLFRRDGHQVDTAANGHLALTRLQERNYDLILCDLRMPELDGPGLYRALEIHAPHLLQRFIFLTGDTLSPEAHTFFTQTGAIRLTKPFRASEVRRIVQRTLQAPNLAEDSPSESNVSLKPT
jgi:two-component system NtrC family sensor kinase